MPLLHATHSFGWSTWHLAPSILGISLIVVGGYIYLCSRENSGANAARVAFFSLGTSAMLLALISPLDAGAHRLLALHMLQHVVLTTVGPPLIILGLPPVALGRLIRLPVLSKVVLPLTAPITAAVIFIINMWFWHIPPVYELALNQMGVHIAMHIAFMATGLVFWWPVIQPVPELSRVGDAGRLLYLFVTGFPMGILALMLIASSNPVYGYYDTASPLFGLSPVVDQQVAGLIMGALGEAAAFIAMTLLFFRFLDKDERAADAALGRLPSDVA